MPKRKTRSSTKAAERDEDEQPDHKQGSPKNEASQETPETTSQDKEAVHHYTIPSHNNKLITCDRRSPQNHYSSPPALIFTHGAGGGISAPSTSDLAAGFASLASIVCYQGSMNLTNRIKYFHTVLEHATGDEAPGAIALGGRSMGARAAVLTALEQHDGDSDPSSKAKALVLVSYPLLAGGTTREPERREKILTDLIANVDVLFIAGAADSYCPLDMLEEVRGNMAARSWLCIVEGADHGMGMKPKKAEVAMRRKTGEVAAKWLAERDEGKRSSVIRCDEAAEIMFEGWIEEETSEPKEKKQKT
ncbi:Putative KAT8 regulatory NSL complex subunit 3/Testis-expressed sequence 30 protein [Septoria linicola]|uniref:KAT8 regulatory NSL complex subunit 3/Testis-expressed sequence 30 protein n=1 Tax=Septoria linicola TaxID=215465 RepID=A0A9Q9EPF5_9PEZI|nr:putative KAT8 regulatory NSL complex subunit 3/Testis-expressed sequence 30 protein [Septoria linicola]USW57662.1 Putative KAT8 regulatory NSL complex subunit 3/Testis-expressed sequence 30 protein [Septoria linicola]